MPYRLKRFDMMRAKIDDRLKRKFRELAMKRFEYDKGGDHNF